MKNLTETECKILYDKKPKIAPDDETFGMILQFAAMYALGRMSPTCTIVINYISRFVPYIDSRALTQIQNQILNQLDFYGLNADCEREKWVALYGTIGKELRKRGVSDGET